MTWYASEILLRPTEAAQRFLIEHPVLAPVSYLIPASLIERPGPPDDPGLLIVQPIGDPEDRCAVWFGQPFLSWSDFRAEGDVLSPDLLCRDHGEAEAGWFPPVPFLAWLKALSHRLATDLAFYHYFSWGGDAELEYAWLFGAREEAHLLIFGQGGEVVDVMTRDGVMRRSNRGVLNSVVNYLGGHLPGFDFRVHYRGFPWADHALDAGL